MIIIYLEYLIYYINNKLVSSSYGYATGQTANSIDFNLSGSWHISNKEYHNIQHTASRPSNNAINGVFSHYNMFGLSDFTIEGQYTLDTINALDSQY